MMLPSSRNLTLGTEVWVVCSSTAHPRTEVTSRVQGHDQIYPAGAWAVRHPGKQCGHPVCVPSAHLPRGQVGCHHRRVPLVGIPQHQSSTAVHAGPEVGQDHQHGIHARACGLALQERLQRSQAWHSRLDAPRLAVHHDGYQALVLSSPEHPATALQLKCMIFREAAVPFSGCTFVKLYSHCCHLVCRLHKDSGLRDGAEGQHHM